MERAIEQALADGIPHREGVAFCLNRLPDKTPQLGALDLSSRPELVSVREQPVGVAHFNELLEVVS